MIDLKHLYVEVFKAIRNDKPLLELLEIDYKNMDSNKLTASTRQQVVDTSRIDDLLTNYKTRICITEMNSSVRGKNEIGYLRIDILMTQDKNKIDRRLLKTVNRVIRILDTELRLKDGKNKLTVGYYGLNLSSRIPKESSSSTGWDKYSMVFDYTHPFAI